MTILTATIKETASLDHARALFMDDLGDWIGDCIERYGDAPATDVHDQATFTTSWGPWIRHRDDGRAVAFMLDLARKIREHFEQRDLWYHGYWRRQEVHHGTEHFELFLGLLVELAPQSQWAKDQLLDACEHIGNWVDGVPKWFDWDTSLFVSTHLGTTEVKTGAGHDINVPDHLRMINLCLLAHRVGGGDRYLKLATSHCAVWANAINRAAQLPLALVGTGWLETLSASQTAVYGSFVKTLNDFEDPVGRAENFLASNGVDAFLSIWQKTSDHRYRRAAERLLDVLATQIGDADAGPAVDALRRYRRATGDKRYDAAVLRAADALNPFDVGVLGLEPVVDWGGRPSGVGKRKDMAKWLEDGRPRRHGVVLLSLAAEIKRDPNLARRCLELGRSYIALARQAYSDGREHGCSGRSVSAIARGHGRDNNTGLVTGVLEPLLSLEFREPVGV